MRKITHSIIGQFLHFVGISLATFILCERPFRLLAGFLLSKFKLNRWNLDIDFIRLKNGLLFKQNKFLEPADLFVVWETWFKRVYTKGLDGNINIGLNDIIFDIGANRGLFSVYVSRIATEGKVYSFEPVQNNFNVLQENIRTNNITNIVAENLAVGKEEGSLPIHLNHATDVHSFYWTNSEASQMVKVVRLEDYCRKNNIQKIDLLKLDCEGAEYDILSTLSPQFAQSIKKVSMEYHSIPNHLPEELVGRLEKLGFKVMHFGNGFLRAINKNLL